MKRRLLVACLVASSTCSFAFAQTSTPTANPKTTQKSYAQPATQVSRAAQAAGRILGVAAAAPPAADACVTPAVASLGANAYDTTLCTTGLQGQMEALCSVGFNTGVGTAIDNDLWFVWTDGGGGGCTKISNCGGTHDSKLAVYAGAGCPGAGAIACNDDACGLQSAVSIIATPGATYTIQLGSYQGTSGSTGTLVIAQFPPGAGNDDCAAPAVAVIGVNLYDNSAATTGCPGQSESLCGTGGGSAIENDLWFTWTAPAAGFTGYVSVSTCGLSTDDSKLAAYAGAGCPASWALACRDDTCGTGQTTIVFPVSVGSTYMIQVGNKPGLPGGAGNFFDIEYVVPPSNDFCTSPQVLTIVSGANVIPFDNTNATTGVEGQDAATFGCSDGRYGSYSDVWFEFVAPPGSNSVDIKTCGPGDSKLTVWKYAGCPSAAYLDCNDNGGSCNPQSEILGLAVTPGVTYTIQIGSAQRLQLGASLLGGGHIMAPGNMTIQAYFALPTTTFCEPGVSGVIACPCTNPPAGSDQGCNNKDNTGGAQLTATGLSKLGEPLATSLVFTDSGQNFTGSQTSILLQGKAPTTGGPFGHGVKCVGAFLRLYNHSTIPWVSGGTAVMPIAPDATIDVRSAAAGQPIPIGAPRYYQMYYRDNVNFLPAATCSIATSKFNISDGQWCYWTN